MSLHTRYRPTPFHAGPSAHWVPIWSRLIDVLKTMYWRKRGSRATISGSGYAIGSSRDQSRGVGTGEICCGAWACVAARAATDPSVAARNVLRSMSPSFRDEIYTRFGT